MILFLKALFLATTFPKIVKNSNFIIEILSKISLNFPTIHVFLPNARKINADFVKFFEKYAKIKHYLQFSKEFFENF